VVSKKHPVLYGPDNKPLVPSVDEKSKVQDINGKQDKTRPIGRKQLAKPQVNKRRPLWSRIPGWIWGSVVFLTLVITLLEGVPWLSVEENELLDPRNPYSALFYVANDGYAPISDLDVDCIVNFESASQHIVVRGSPTIEYSHFADYLSHSGGSPTIEYSHFADYLSHSERATLPCFHAVVLNTPSTGAFKVNGDISKATLSVIVYYSYYPLSWKPFRRHQVFHFQAIPDSTGSLHWTFSN
jgi:hypothetical protein